MAITAMRRMVWAGGIQQLVATSVGHSLFLGDSDLAQ